MSTNRELFFRYKKAGISEHVIYFALEQCNGFNHISLVEHFDDNIKDEIRFFDAMNRYLSGEMIEYIFHKSYFLGDEFYLNKNVLIPRQETEQLVLLSEKLIKEMFPDDNIIIADVCTGSGAIGISLAKRFKNDKVVLSDISEPALEVASKNIDEMGLNNVELLKGDMLEPFIQKQLKLDAIVCNPPYIEDFSSIDLKTWNEEPHLALLASPSTFFYEKIFKEFRKVVGKKYLLCFEIGEDMEESLTKLVRHYCKESSFSFEKDIYNKTRFLLIKGENI